MEQGSVTQFDSCIDRYEGIRGHYVDVPMANAALFTAEKNKRLLCSINRGEPFHCSLRPKGDGNYTISVGTPVRTAGKLQLGQKVVVELWEDHSTYGRAMPEELTELLSQDEEGNRLFHELKPSEQRGMLYYIGQSKNVQTRIDRAIKMINRLKLPGGLKSH